jgi:hypothetical protein
MQHKNAPEHGVRRKRLQLPDGQLPLRQSDEREDVARSQAGGTSMSGRAAAMLQLDQHSIFSAGVCLILLNEK